MKQDDLSGQHLAGYQVIKPIGSGGMAKIYLARNKQKQPVALKVLLPHLQSQREFGERFLREANNSAKLKHPGIVTVRDYKKMKDGTTFFVMDWIDGGSLAEMIKKRGQPIHPKEAAQIISQVASALDYAHSQGIIHRDIKPSNILMSRQGQAILADFGVSKVAQATTLTRPGDQPGTPAYMAPEQAKGETVSPATDVYALGVVLYEMLAGRPPFQGDTSQVMAVLYQQVHQPPPPIRQFNPHISPAMEKVIDKALAKKVVERYQSAGELAQAVWGAVEGPISSGGQTLPANRWPLFVGVGVMIFILLSLLGGVGYYLTTPSPTTVAEVTPSPTVETHTPTPVPEDSGPAPLVPPTRLSENDDEPSQNGSETLTPDENESDSSNHPPVTLLAPADGATFEAGESILLQWRWRSLDEDERYHITMQSQTGQSREWYNTEDEFNIPDRLPPGTYRWLVTVEDREESGFQTEERSDSQTFTISAPPIVASPTSETPRQTPSTPAQPSLSAPQLTDPPDQYKRAFSEDITLKWRTSSGLTDEQCYVLIIQHQQGLDFSWLSQTSYTLSRHNNQNAWLADPQYGPNLKWQVVIAQKEEACQGKANPAGAELSPRSETRSFSWVK